MASGLTPAEVARFVAHILEARDRYGITVIWVEHIISALVAAADRLVVLEQGSVIGDGPPRALLREERVLRSYIGSAERALQ